MDLSLVTTIAKDHRLPRISLPHRSVKRCLKTKTNNTNLKIQRSKFLVLRFVVSGGVVLVLGFFLYGFLKFSGREWRRSFGETDSNGGEFERIVCAGDGRSVGKYSDRRRRRCESSER